MKILIYRHKSFNSIIKLENINRYMEKGISMEDIEKAIESHNNDDGWNNYVELHEVAEQDEEIIKACAVDTMTLFTDKIIHACAVPVPNNTYIYVFKKHEGHITPALEVMKVHGDGVILPELEGKQGVLPIAWCKASDLLGMLGINKRNINKLTATAKSLAWAWYKEETQ